MKFETLTIEEAEGVAWIRLARPDKANAMNAAMWRELALAVRRLDEEPSLRVGVITGSGRHFTAGIDLEMLAELTGGAKDACPGRLREKLRRQILRLQDVVTSIERCAKPVLAAVNGPCIGAGVDLVTACDMRYCSEEAYFSVKEVDLGLAADVGTLQRLPRLVGEGLARELAYTARRVPGREAEAIRLVNRCYPDGASLADGVRALARTIAGKSPLAIRGTKEMITHARDHSVADGLLHVATWNASMLLSADVEEAVRAATEKRAPEFRD